jgi:hypothetical protein
MQNSNTITHARGPQLRIEQGLVGVRHALESGRGAAALVRVHDAGHVAVPVIVIVVVVVIVLLLLVVVVLLLFIVVVAIVGVSVVVVVVVVVIASVVGSTIRIHS